VITVIDVISYLLSDYFVSFSISTCHLLQLLIKLFEKFSIVPEKLTRKL